MKFCSDFQKYKSGILLQFTVIFIICSPIQSTRAQSFNNQLKIAKSLERSHNYENALKIYQDIYKKSPRNMAAIAGVKNCYIGLQQYAELIQYLEKVVTSQGAQRNWQVDLAEAYFLNNEKEQAFSLWKRFLEVSKTDPAAYRLVAGTMIRQRLFDEAISVYTDAMQNLKKQEILHLDIANLYRAQLNYEKATEHYLQYYMYFPKQFTFVQNQLLVLSTKISDSSPVTNAILVFLKQNPNQAKIREILAGIYLKDKNFEAAFIVYKNLETDKSAGKFLYRYAIEAYANDAFNYTIEGYEYLIQNYPSSPLIPQVKYELGRSYAALAYALDHNKESSECMQIAVGIFEKESSKVNNQIYALNSTNSLGDIYFNYYFDLDTAIKYYTIYLNQVSNSKSRDNVLIKIGNVYLTKNQSDQALSAYQLVSHKNLNVVAGYKIAEIYFYNHEFSVAHKHLKTLSRNISADNPLMNDILSRSLLLKSFSQDSVILSKYADAELLKFQKKYTEAAEEFYKISEDKNKLQSLSGREAGKLYLKLKNFDSAKKVLGFLRTEIPEDKDFDEILFLLAESEEGLNNFQEAIDIFHELMVAYPNSMYIHQSREKARALNEKITQEQI